ncbi:MAG: hypothetical protein HFG34_02535 [Eubacterium sp.]|nr:hypothetical protein [Eubacterium sp.]
MKKYIRQLVAGFLIFCMILGMLLCVSLFGMSPRVIRAAVNADGSVAINEENFPDEKFRHIASQYDIDKNQILTLAERSVLKNLTLEYVDPVYYQDKTDYDLIASTLCGPGTAKPEELQVSWRSGKEDHQTLSVKGIEYFPELQIYRVNGYDKTEGSLKNNSKLKKIMIGVDDYGGQTTWPCKWANCYRLGQDFPMKQLETIQIGPAFECSDFSLREAVNLEELQIGVGSKDHIVNPSLLGRIDLSANKKLKRIWFHGVKVKRLDLSKNTKIQEIKIEGNKYFYDFYKSGKRAGGLYADASGACELKLPKSNSLKKLVYMAKNKKLDLTRCKKLSLLKVPSGVQVKFNLKWYQSYGKKKLTLYTRGTKTKKNIEKKSAKNIFIKTKRMPDRSTKNDKYDSQPYIHG